MTWNISNLYKYPEIRQFVIGKKLDIKNNSYLSEAISRNYQRLEFIEYFLKHSKDLVIHNNFRDKLFQYLVKECTGVQDKKDLESLLAELEAFYLLQNKFGLNICAYEPQLCGQKKIPDFKVEFNNAPVYFEVKCRCNVEAQRIPEKIDEFLDRIELEYNNKYVISIMEVENSEDKNKRPNYLKLFGKYLCDPDILKPIEKEINETLNRLEHTNILTQQNRNTSGVEVENIKAGKEKINVHFLICLRQNKGQKRQWYFNPDDIENVEEWLLRPS